jgi:phosphoglycolate phosphatase-like HAD superfamily hydrolase
MIVFDLDGTLVDSDSEIIGAMDHAWRETERGAFPRERFRVGPPLMSIVKMLGAARPDALAAAFRARYDASDFAETRPFPGIIDVLEGLGASKVAIATNKRRAPTEKILARWFAGRFARVACSDALDGMAGTYSKAAMVRALGGEVLVGDTVADIEAAREAGVRAIAVTWGYDPAEILEKAAPDALIREPSRLLGALVPTA